MKNRLHVAAVAACLLIGAMSGFVAGQDLAGDDAESRSPDNHDQQFTATLGCRSVLVQTKVGALSTTSASYTQLTGGTITIPAGQTGYLLATFSAESQCTGTFGAWCTVRITRSSDEMNPAVGTEFAFDSVDGSGDDLWEANSMQRISGLLGAGTWVVNVDWAVVGSATFRLDDWLFKVEYWRVS